MALLYTAFEFLVASLHKELYIGSGCMVVASFPDLSPQAFITCSMKGLCILQAVKAWGRG